MEDMVHVVRAVENPQAGSGSGGYANQQIFETAKEPRGLKLADRTILWTFKIAGDWHGCEE